MDELEDGDRWESGDEERVTFVQVLAPLDGSEAARGALGWAAALAGADGEVVLLEVTPAAQNVRTVIGREIATAAQVQQGYTQLAARRLADAAAAMPTGVRTRIEVETGEPVEEILRTAEREGVGLIVLTFSGAGAWGPFARAQVMERVARSGKRPVLVVPTDAEPGRIGEILVPIDGSEAALTALPVAAEFGAALGAGVHVVQAVSADGPLPTAAMGIAHPDVIAREFRGAPRSVAEAAVAAAVDRLGRLGASARGSILTGNPVATVVAAAERAGGSALVVVPRPGSAAVAPAGEANPEAEQDDGSAAPARDRVSWTVGGVAEALLRAGTVPVVVVPGAPR